MQLVLVASISSKFDTANLFFSLVVSFIVVSITALINALPIAVIIRHNERSQLH